MNVVRNAVGAAALAVLAMGPAQAETDHTTLALPSIAFIFATAYIAQDAGFYKAEDLEVKEQMITGIGATNAVIAGSVDFAFASGVTLTRAVARGQPVIAIAGTFNHPGFAVVVKKSIADAAHFNPNASLAERAKVMKGLRFAVGAVNAIPHAYLKRIAKEGGLDGERDLVVTAMLPADMPGAMERDAIDGFSNGPPVSEQVVMEGKGVVVANGVSGAIEPPEIADMAANVALTRASFCAEHRPICVKIAQAFVKANAFMHAHPDEAMALLGKRLNVADPGVLAAAYKDTLDSTPSPPVLSAQELANADLLNIEAGFMKPEEKLPSYDKLFTNEFVRGAAATR